MSQLIITVIAIALFAGLICAGTNYVNQDKMMISQEETRMRNGIVQLRSAVTIYYNNFGEFPDNYDQIKVHTSSMNFPTGMTIESYSNDESTGDHYFCIRSKITPVITGSITALRNNNPSEKLYVNNQCGKNVDMQYDKLSSNFYLNFFL